MNYFPEWPYDSFAVCELSQVYQEFQTGGGISHSFLCLDTLGCFPNLLCQMWENLFTPRKGFQESPERFNSLVIKSESVLQKGWVPAHGQMGPRLLIPSLRAPSLDWNHFPSLKEVSNTHGVNALEMYLLSFFTSAARYAQAIVAGIMEMLSSQRHFVSNNIFILHPSLAGGEFFCLLKSHSSFGTKCSPVSRVRRWFYWRTVLQTKTMLYFTTPFELPLCHFPEERDRPTTKLCFKILCPI